MTKRLLFAIALVMTLTTTTAFTPQWQFLDDLRYKKDGDPNHVLDAYLPAGNGPFPVVIVIHGQRIGDEDGVDGLARAFANQGYVGVSVDYRDWGHPVWPAQLDDLHAAIDWIRGHTTLLKAKPSRMGMLGVSMGGFPAAMLATSGRRYRPDVVATWSGKMDLTTWSQMNGLILGKAAAKDEKVLVANSPTLRVPTHGAPPWFIANSRCEWVPLSQPRGMAAALATARIPYQLKVVQKCLHGGAYWYLVIDDMMAFFHRWL
ncbi:MAG: alpha/beta hydrolase [Actinobacteria bacterium]|nr:MAG: alpha/beta hydrolase [Actinomycetota bacterium]